MAMAIFFYFFSFLNTMHCSVLVLEGALCLQTTFAGSLSTVGGIFTRSGSGLEWGRLRVFDQNQSRTQSMTR